MNLKLKMAILESFPRQADFAAAMGCHESKVSQVVCGRRRLDEKETTAWCATLGCSAEIFKSKGA